MANVKKKPTNFHEHLGKDLDSCTVDELHQMCRDLDIDGHSKMKKDELISAIQERRGDTHKA